MTELLTCAQMRAIEAAAIASGSVTGLDLMERAGIGVIEAVFDEWPAMAETSHHAVVLCGPGNNGGDGFVVARLLKQRGWGVDVFLYGDPDKLPTDARTNYERWCEAGEVKTYRLDPAPLIDDFIRYPDEFDLLVDAVFGTGLKRPFRGIFASMADDTVKVLLKENGVRVVSVDVPSGVCSDSGRPLMWAISADLTVSFHRMKLGHVLGFGAVMSGKAVVKDIGLESWPHPRVGQLPPPVGVGGGSSAVPPSNVVNLVTGPSKSLKKHSTHKYSHGHALVLSGPTGQTGAARLAARGALRIGAGVVTVASPKSAMLENAMQLTAIMIHEADGPQALKRTLEDERINALCLGPALGLDSRASKLVAIALEAKRMTVLDADALTLLSQDEALFAALHPSCVLTPHAGEFKRLFPDLAEKLDAPASTGPAYSKVDATREAAKRAGCTVLCKGPDTVIASPDGQASVNASLYERAAPWLATAGSGDVLAGFITGLMARGFSPHHAAETGAYLHSECALSFGAGLIAEDLPEELPKVFTALGI
ncbi:NAD(P)H-hydrate dehydratase [Pacificibacter marinus]|uniref:NAD(P)H-hydrate dehydratase n=1 Tax=Pacificibacter marinus TaxID=658057 RepID=UPI001C072A41|nr:NAD(P)H-hydrate dehydratase [Pacificibacter marinus]MBU2868441.1 NAD(P)H-hydrate dehydratase [Pacificibacter marinus]